MLQLIRFKALGLLLVTFLLPTGNLLMAAPTKSCSSPEYRQFDFWIGEWEVKDAKGKLLGHNKIFPILDGCALSENWTSAGGNPGVSTNFYDKSTKQWHQTWIDNNGGSLYLNGNLIDGVMVLTDQTKSSKTIQKISWTPLDDGRVKQHWEASKDQGKTWSDVFIGFYERK
jgi:hypothetical protein